MFDRKELKARAKESFRANYWKCVLIGLILTLVQGGIELIGEGDFASIFSYDVAAIIFVPSIRLLFVLFILAIFAVGAVVDCFLINPLTAGCKWFMVHNAKEPAGLEHLGAGFKNYLPVVKNLFFAYLYTLLWGLLLIVPGVIASYNYRMVPYLALEHPELSTREILDLSREMMYGRKWDTFVMDLSFLGWNILAGLTGGILGIFYVMPYRAQTDANLYLWLKEQHEYTL